MCLFGVCVRVGMWVGCKTGHAACSGFSHTLASLVWQPCDAGVSSWRSWKEAGIVGIAYL